MIQVITPTATTSNGCWASGSTGDRPVVIVSQDRVLIFNSVGAAAMPIENDQFLRNNTGN